MSFPAIFPLFLLVLAHEAKVRVSAILFLCWVRAASGPFLENNLLPLKVGLRWGFVNGLKWVQNWVKNEFLGAKVCEMGQTHSSTTFDPCRDIDETHF